MRMHRKRGAIVAPERERGRLPLIEAERNFRFRIGRRSERAFFWVEWGPAKKGALPQDAVLVLAERRR